MMNMRFMIALLAGLILAPLAMTGAALADAAQPFATAAAQAPAQAATNCPRPAEQQFNTSQLTTDCCKDHKGVCGCRAGKIVCCDRTISEQPGCTCHGDDGFLQ